MIVAKIVLSEMSYSGVLSRYTAKIRLTGPDATLSLDCAAYFPPDHPRNAVASALISDAMRQLQWRPEIRLGHEHLTIAPGALPKIARDLY
jgi:hypothetical protein